MEYKAILLFIFLFSFCQSGLKEQLLFLKSEVLAEHENILNFWEKYTVDEEYGGFIGQIDSDMTKQIRSDKGVILNARITWAFSAAYIYTKKNKYLELAKRAYEYLIDYFYDKENDGVYFMINYQGNSTIDRNQVIAVAFVTYAFSEYYRASKDEGAYEYASKLFNSLETHALDKESGGYFDAFSKEWEMLKEMKMYPGDVEAKKTMNANFHIMVAYANMYRAKKEEKVKNALEKLIDVLINNIIDTERGACKLFFDENWKVIPSEDNYGLDIEASWLIWDAAKLLGDDKIKEKVRPVVLKIVEHCLKYGYDNDGGMMNEGNDEKITNSFKSWWVQAETVIAFFNAFEMTNESKYLARALHTWDFIKKNVIDYSNGEWFGTIGKDDHKPNLEESKIGPWKCPYHNSRMGLQLAERIDEFVNAK